MRMLRKAWDAISVIHSVGGVRVEVTSVSGELCLHFTAAFIGWIEILVVDTEEEGV
jgi:hypothetical protein